MFKFRGKSKTTNEWLYGDLLHIAGVPYIIYNEMLDYANNSVHPDSVGELICTIENQEFYSNDIVFRSGRDEFEDRIGHFKKLQIGWAIIWDNGNQFHHISSDVKVVGNSFDNPELLDKKG